MRRQCALLGLAAASYYYQAVPESAENLLYQRLLDEEYTRHPFYGVRKMTVWLRLQRHAVGPKRVRRLLRAMGLMAVYPKPRLSLNPLAHQRFPYLLKGLAIVRPNQVWSTDITYIRLRGGFVYLAAVIDWYSRAVLAWELSNTLDATFCANAMQRAIAEHGVPDIVNTDQGSQFTSAEFTEPLLKLGIKLSMDGKGRCLDNVFVERLWRTVKYEEIYLKSYRSQIEAYANLDTFFRFYNEERPHSAFGDAQPLSPMEVYRGAEPIAVNQ